MGKGFVSVKLIPEDARKIAEVLKTLGVDGIEAHKMHVTLMYDKSDPDIDLEHNKDKAFKATVTGVERLGEKGSEWEAIAFSLDSPDLCKRHEVLKDAGFKHSFSNYKCHMSLVYKPAIDDFDKIDLINVLKGFPKTLTFYNETCKPLKD